MGSEMHWSACWLRGQEISVLSLITYIGGGGKYIFTFVLFCKLLIITKLYKCGRFKNI
jgi:hypothetical protein